MTTGKWILVVGAALVLVGFFLPMLGIAMFEISLSQVAGLLNQVMLYLVPIAMIVMLLLTFIPADPTQARTYAYIQIAAWVVSVFGIFITFYSIASKAQALAGMTGLTGGLLQGLGDIVPDLGGIISGITLTLRLGFYMLLVGHILALTGAIMSLNETPSGSQVVEPVYPVYPQERESGRTLPPERPMPRGTPANAVLFGQDRQQHQLYKGVTNIGRSSSNHIRLMDGHVSSRHAKIIEQNGHFTLHDLASKNHTFVNGSRIYQPTILQSNDEIDFGGYYKATFVAQHR